MIKIVRCLPITLLGLLVLVPNSRATQLDFGCNPGAVCTGAVAVVSGNFSASGVAMENTDSSTPVGWGLGSLWILAFDTSTSSISLTNATLGTLMGVIQSFTPVNGSTTSSLTMTVLWNSLTSAAITFFGGATAATDVSTVVKVGLDTVAGNVNSASVTMFPTPEPASLALLGSGLIMLGGIFRRRLQAKHDQQTARTNS